MRRRRENQKVRDQNQKVRDQRRHHNQQQLYRLDHHNNQHNRQLMKCLPHHLRNHRQNHLRLHPRRIFVVHVKIVLRSVSKTMTARHAILTLQINLSRDVKRCKMEGALDSFVLLPVKVDVRKPSSHPVPRLRIQVHPVLVRAAHGVLSQVLCQLRYRARIQAFILALLHQLLLLRVRNQVLFLVHCQVSSVVQSLVWNRVHCPVFNPA